ncbi:hypothetical protein GOD21_15065 [Sinorhizobium medicae]|nr:hypothetical protein [Sinorhizobium medicae]
MRFLKAHIALICIGMFLPVSSAWADFSGVQIKYGRLTIQFMIDEEIDPSVRRLLFGEGDLVSQVARILIGQDQSSRTIDKDLALEVEPDPPNFNVYFSSNSLDLDTTFPDSVSISSAEQLIGAICAAAKLDQCEPMLAGPESSGVVLNEESQSLPNEADAVLITIGSLPSEDVGQQIVLPGETNPEGLQAIQGEEMPLSDAIRKRADEFYQEINLLEEVPDGNLQLAAQREFFVVHCTAFGASDKAMRAWVQRNIDQGKKNKSHGVILPSGEWLPMWPFAMTQVWATKTETCRQTRATALGSAINIELHYYCGTGRSDKASVSQYRTLANIYKQLSDKYGLLKVVSHKEVDRGLRDGHSDPIAFSFDAFYQELQSKGINIASVKKISDVRHNLRTSPDVSHHWRPMLDGALVLERNRPDDCKRDHE